MFTQDIIRKLHYARLAHLSRAADFVAAGRLGLSCRETASHQIRSPISLSLSQALSNAAAKGAISVWNVAHAIVHAKASSNRRYKIKHRPRLEQGTSFLQHRCLSIPQRTVAIGFIDREETR